MTVDAQIENCEAIPRSPEWYAQATFDSSLVAFRDNEGMEHRYMITPLDEIYANEPGDSYRLGTIPPEEREVRDTLLVAVALRQRVSWLDFWWSQFAKPTKAYRASLECFRKLHALCASSREYRAAFCRLSKSDQIDPGLCRELKRIVDICDRGQVA